MQDGGGRCIREQWGQLPECVAPSLAVSQLEFATDLLAPMMLLPDSNVTWRAAPWEAKSRKAFFRGVPSCGEMPKAPGVCGRTAIAALAAERPDILDAGARTRGCVMVYSVLGCVRRLLTQRAAVDRACPSCCCAAQQTVSKHTF